LEDLGVNGRTIFKEVHNLFICRYINIEKKMYGMTNIEFKEVLRRWNGINWIDLAHDRER
jgi:hypothetical protein